MSFRLKKAGVDLLYQDENYVLVSKPSGLLSIQDRFQHDLPNLKQILQDEFGEIYTVHRLDKETSGIITQYMITLNYLCMLKGGNVLVKRVATH